MLQNILKDSPFLKEIFLKKIKISENNTISVKVAMVLWYQPKDKHVLQTFKNCLNDGICWKIITSW